jgi:hypothetical protein
MTPRKLNDLNHHVRCSWYFPYLMNMKGEAIMPDFAIVSVQEARLRTLSGRQGKVINEYASYIQQLAPEQAGKLHVWENEKPLTIRRRLTVTAQTLGIPLVIKRSGQDIYFWAAELAEAQPRQRRGGRRRRQAETETPEQYFKEIGELTQGETEESTELGQTP